MKTKLIKDTKGLNSLEQGHHQGLLLSGKLERAFARGISNRTHKELHRLVLINPFKVTF